MGFAEKHPSLLASLSAFSIALFHYNVKYILHFNRACTTQRCGGEGFSAKGKGLGRSRGRRPGGEAAETDRRSACPPEKGGRPAAPLRAPRRPAGIKKPPAGKPGRGRGYVHGNRCRTALSPPVMQWERPVECCFRGSGFRRIRKQGFVPHRRRTAVVTQPGRPGADREFCLRRYNRTSDS